MVGQLRGFQLSAYPAISFYGFGGYDSGVCLPSDIVSRFTRVRFKRLLTLRYRFSVYEGTIQAFAYPPISFLGLRGYDSGVCLPSDIVLQFPRVRFGHLLTLPNRMTVLQGTIEPFVCTMYPADFLLNNKKDSISAVLFSACLATSYSHRGKPPTTIGAESLTSLLRHPACDELRISSSASLVQILTYIRTLRSSLPRFLDLLAPPNPPDGR